MRQILTTLTVLFFMSFTLVQAQTGSIQGTVKDSETNEEIIGAIVKIPGTSFGAPTDVFGSYRIDNVPAGTYSLEISSLSYSPKTIPSIVVTAGKTATSNIILEQNTASLSEVVVIGEKIRNTDAAVLAEMREAKMVVSAISGEQIARSQDRDAAQVVRRVPGVTILNDRFIMVRGLGDRYNSVLLNNTFAPSMETDVRSFAFNTVPSSQIDRIFVYKSPSPELPGDFAGGAVKIFTKSIPPESSVVLDYSIGIRNGTTFNTFKQQETGNLHWTGFNDGYLNLPNGFPNNVRSINSPDELQKWGRSLRNNWAPRERVAIPDQRIGLTYNKRFNIGDIEVGNITAINYSNSLTTFNIDRNDHNRYDFINDQPDVIYHYDDVQYTQNIRTGLIHNWAFRFNNQNTIEFKNLFNQLSTTQFVDRTGLHREFNYIPENGAFDQIFRNMYVGQLTGKHTLSVDSDFRDTRTLDWTLAYNHSGSDQPDYRRYRRDIQLEAGDDPQQESILYVGRGVSPDFLGRFFSEMNENSVSGAVNYSQKLDLGSSSSVFAAIKPTLNAGLFFENKSRNFQARNIGYVAGSSAGYEQENPLWRLPLEQIFLPENINNTTGLKIDEQSNPTDSYKASNTLSAAYTSLTLPVGTKITAVVGARVENNIMKLNGEDTNNTTTKVLPSANVSYNLTDKMLIRAAYGLTVNRPEFRELAPFSFYDFNFNSTIKGEPGLRTASIQNMDLRWELYPSANELISVGVFNKQFKDAIERVALFGQGGSGGAKVFGFLNAQSAYSRGVEVDVKKSFAGLSNSSFLDDLSLLMNASYISSEVELGDDPRTLGQSNNRPLQGQSRYIANAGLFYNNIASGIQVNLNYNIIGRRIFIVGTEQYPDIYEMPRSVLDISVSKQFTPYFQAKIGIVDIFNQESLLLQDGNQDGKLDRKTDQVFARFHPGQLINIGISYSFGKRQL
ncbi:TonB-dependent receptor domain-containing protein [Pontibacter sp. 13R65]|uniref:TonB-dependent receptor n=1 Tax=Pontibacter sp. 13R65 TaxID=3127458 RepID=UPI00301C5D15